MIRKIIEAMGQALYAEFGDGYNVYAEEVKQDLQEPCFFIGCLKFTRSHQRGNCYLYQNRFHVQYFPSSDLAANDECHAVAARLFELLELLSVNGGLRRGTAMEYEIVDDLLHFFVSYDFYAVKAGSELPVMVELQSKTELKERDDTSGD